MRQALSVLISWALLILLIEVIEAEPNCPWDDPELKKWSEPGTWPSGKIPQENDDVTVPKDVKVMLDTEVPRFRTLTIEGTLVWGNVDGIRIESNYVLVNGEFIIGTEECNFEKAADIFLYGLSNSTLSVEGFDRKFIGANTNSRLEFHGKQKLSWTKLIETVSPPQPGLCGFVYDSDDENVKKRFGIWLSVWSADGTKEELVAFDFANKNKQKASLEDLVHNIKSHPDGKIVAVGVLMTLGDPSEDYEEFYQLMESLGATQIRNVKAYEPYVFVGETGKPDCVVEKYTSRREGFEGGVEAVAKFGEGELVFTAQSYSEIKDRGRFSTIRFRVLNRDAAYPKLSLFHDVSSWEVGDEVIVASTDFEWKQAETRTIVACRECAPNQIRVDGDFQYTHFGKITYGVEERAEVGLLTRNIRLDAELQPDCYFNTDKEEANCKRFRRDTYGGHVKFVHNSYVKVEGVQIQHMGQQGIMACYPLHFHLAEDVSGQYVRNNVIRHSNSRCVTIHGTDHLDVSNNVCVDHLGHGIFLEDSAEQNNTIHRNLIIGSQYGTLLLTDMNVDWCKERAHCGLLSSYWITHPRNIFTDNVAAGSDSFGMVLAFADRPLGPSMEMMKARGLYEENSTRYIKLSLFTRNVMHSNKQGGLWFDSRLSYGQMDMNKWAPENAKIGLNLYSPREPPNPNGTLVESIMSHLTMYKNQDRNSWVRCGNIVITNSSFADSATGYSAGHSGDDLTSCDVRHSIFIGETENKGQPWDYVFSKGDFAKLPKPKRPVHRFDRSISRRRPEYLMSAVQLYQGPVYLDNCYFDKYQTWYYNDSFVDTWDFRPKRPAAAITFHSSNHYPSVPRNGVKNLKWGYCEGANDMFRVMDGNASTPYWTMFDGTQNINFRDYDGSLTGRAGVQIVDTRKYFTTDRCLAMQKWGLSICPYKYFMLVVRGGSGLLKATYKSKSPIFIRRDDVPDDPYKQKGITGHKFTLMVSKSYTLFFNNTIPGGKYPRNIQLRPRFGLEKGEVVRLAICMPKSTTNITMNSKIPTMDPDNYLRPIQVNSLQEVDNDNSNTAWYWDQTNGYVYFKMYSPHALTDPDQECPGDDCLFWEVVREDGDDEVPTCDYNPPPFTRIKDKSKRVKPIKCPKQYTPDSAVGLGATIEDGPYVPPTYVPGTCGYETHTGQ